MKKLALLSITPLVITGNVSASGFAVPEISNFGLGTSNAVVANHKDVGAIPYNPSAMAFHDGSIISVGLMGVAPDMKVSNTTGGSGPFESDADDVLIPQLQGVYKYNEKISFGLGVTAPFGLSTDWSDETFVSANPATDASFPTYTNLEVVATTPTISIKANNNLAFSLGVDYYWAKDVTFNSDVVNVNGDGDGWGWNLGALYTMDDWSIGLSFHSESKIDIKGNYSNGLAPALNADVVADLTLPYRLQLGIRNQVTEKLALEFDITRTGWDSFDVLRVNTTTGANRVTSENHWNDANAYRIGGTYELNGRTQLRFGYSYDKTGQDMNFFSARTADSDRQLFSVGFGHDLGEGWLVEGGYMYVKFDDNDYRASRAQTGADPNGTTSINGDYEANVHLLGFGITKTF